MTTQIRTTLVEIVSLSFSLFFITWKPKFDSFQRLSVCTSLSILCYISSDLQSMSNPSRLFGSETKDWPHPIITR